MLSRMCVIIFSFHSWYVIYHCLLRVFITYLFYFILHVILGVSFYLFHFYFPFCCMSIQSPNPIHILGPFAPFASSPPCTHLHTNLQGPITLHLHLADLNFNSTPSHASTCMTKNQFSAHISRFSACGAEDTPTSTCLFLRGGVDNSLQNKGDDFPLFKGRAKVNQRTNIRECCHFLFLSKESHTGKRPMFCFFCFLPLLLFSLGQLCMETLSLYGKNMRESWAMLPCLCMVVRVKPSMLTLFCFAFPFNSAWL